jgi:uncharacterized protein (TIGR02118 family)
MVRGGLAPILGRRPIGGMRDQGERALSQYLRHSVRHVVLFREAPSLGPAKARIGAQGLSVEQGLGGIQPGSPPTDAMMFHMLFDSVEAFQQSFGPHAEAIVGDSPNYTNAQPTVQISEVKL